MNFTEEELIPLRRRLYNNKVNNALTKGILVDIKFEDIVWSTYCPILGIELYYGKKARGAVEENSPTFDRIDPKLGYTKGNVRIISARANRLKDNGTADEHRRIAAYIEESLAMVKTT